jgi:hypothetical protein
VTRAELPDWPRGAEGVAVMPLRVLSLFAGIGGFDLGLERTGGFKTVAVAETDTYASKVLAKRFPDAPNLGDVTTAEYPDADIICAGFPCQDISYAGEGAGLAGARSGLWREVVRAVRVVGPRFTILENVAALLNRGMGTVLGDLAEVGHDAEWHCIPAAPLAPLTYGTAFGSLPSHSIPTPVAQDHIERKNRTTGVLNAATNKSVSLDRWVRFWPTPRASDRDKGTRTAEGVAREAARNKAGPDLGAVAGGALNPTWVEWLMGFPSGWTDLDASETP